MEIYIVLYKMLLLVYCILKYLNTIATINSFFVLIVLLNISFVFGFYYFKKREIRVSIVAFNLFAIFILSLNFSFIFSILIPISVCELVSILNDKYKISAIIIAFISYFIPQYYLSDYLCFALISLEIYYVLKSKLDRIEKITEKLDKIYVKVDKKEAYENQIIYTSQLEERNKISQEIHDKLGHTIAGSVMQLEASKLLMKENPEVAKVMMENVIKVLREGHESIRCTLRNIKPENEQLGINKVNLLLKQFSINTKIKYSLITDKDIGKLNYKEWSVIIDNLKETLTNTLKYSKATRVEVNISILNQLVKVEIKDNGIGANKIIMGMGLRGMEERTSNIGGKLIIDGSNGFSVITLLKLEDDRLCQ